MNKALLEYEIKSKGYTTKDVLKKLKISSSAYYRKLNGTSEFTRAEIEIFINWLDLNNVAEIFFNKKVS